MMPMQDINTAQPGREGPRGRELPGPPIGISGWERLSSPTFLLCIS